MAKYLIKLALDTVNVLGASYADVRLIQEQQEGIKVKNQRVEVLKRNEDAGIGIRAIVQGCWGFAATSKLDKKSVERTAALAVKVAKASARLKDKAVTLSETEPVNDTYQTKVQIDPFSVPLDEKIDLVLAATKAMQKVKGVKFSEAYLSFKKKYQVFGSTQGSCIEQTIYHSGGYIDSTAIKGNITGERSYPGMHGHYKSAGYEFIKGLDFLENAQRVAEQAVALSMAKECPKIETTVILDGSMVAIQVHETVGHPTELDRVLGTEVSLAGKSHLTPDKLNSFRMGSDMVSVTADATIENGLGSFGYDDEGVKAQKVYLIKDGIFTGYLTSRETAKVLGQRSNGTMRASSWSAIPLIRMTNINLEPGTWNLDDLIADTQDGIYFESAGHPSIDDKRLNYNIHSEIGWIIKNGKKTEMVRRPAYTGISYEIWQNCDAICARNEWEVWGVPNCGKGDPTQTMQVGHGAAPARFRKIKVGS